MAYRRTTTAATATKRTYAPKAPLREVLPATNVYERLDRLTNEILIRMEAELDRYTITQLLSGLVKSLQVQVLMMRLQTQGSGANVGSAVRKYATNFTQPGNAGNRRKANSRSAAAARAADELDNVIDLVTADTDDDE